jgi:four helix bundle protein
MPALPAYKTLEVYNLSKKLVVACYELTHDLPFEEKTNLVQYIRNAAVTVHLTIAQGALLKKKKKKNKSIKAVQNALVVINTSVAVLTEVGLITESQTSELHQLSTTLYQILDGLKKDK